MNPQEGNQQNRGIFVHQGHLIVIFFIQHKDRVICKFVFIRLARKLYNCIESIVIFIDLNTMYFLVKYV